LVAGSDATFQLGRDGKIPEELLLLLAALHCPAATLARAQAEMAAIVDVFEEVDGSFMVDKRALRATEVLYAHARWGSTSNGEPPRPVARRKAPEIEPNTRARICRACGRLLLCIQRNHHLPVSGISGLLDVGRTRGDARRARASAAH